jgi:hypothetical protein
MKFITPPSDIDLHLTAAFKKPKYDQMGSDEGIKTIRSLVEAFELRLDDIKINREALSGQFLQFSKFYASSFFNARFGFEESSLSLRNPFSKKLVVEISERLVKILSDDSFQRLAINMRTHLATEEDLDSFLELLAPGIPTPFEPRLQGRGISFFLGYPEKNLRTSVSVTKSLFFEKSLFLSIECEFTPCLFGFKDAAIAVWQEYAFVINSLGLVPTKEDW